jgi:uncharacterized membrane protein YhhN
MNPASTSIIVCAVAVSGLLLAEQRRSEVGKWLTKPAASAAFVAVALASGALESVYGQLLLAGLLLCLVGDILLIPEQRPAVFRAGVFAFLAGHVAYAAAFLTRPLSATWMMVAAALILLVLWQVWRWLRTTLPRDMRVPVQAYFAVIGVMSILACGVTGAGGPAVVAVGALAFTASDISVARDRFVRPQFLNRAWGLPLYYAAQVLLALSPAVVFR